MLYSNYTEQFERVKRYQAKIHQHDRATVDQADDVWSFFINCWNLKDWVKNDDSLPKATRDKIINEVEANETLMICADMANRSKHRVLDKRKRKDAKMSGIGVTIHAPVIGSGKSCRSEHHFLISVDDGREFDALELADKCVKEWEEIFSKSGLKVT